MTCTLLQIIAFAALGIYLFRSRAVLRRRNARSWDSLVARLRPGWNARELSDDSFSNRRSNATPYQKLERILGAHGLWAIFQNAGVMMEMADYATRNSDSFDRELLIALRGEAMRVRVLVVEVIAEFAFAAIGESVSISALRVESAYAEMALQITELLTINAPEALPGFVGAI